MADIDRNNIFRAFSTSKLPGWAILPLRIFLAISFLAAGLDKLGDPAFLDPSARDYIGQQIARFAPGTPLEGFLLNFAVPNATLFGVMVMGGELCIGIAVLLGLLTRFSAFMGLLLNLTFFLSATWDVQPFYFGADLPYVACWLTLLLAGPGPLALDVLLKRRLAPEPSQGPWQATNATPMQGDPLTRRALLGAGAAGLVGGILAATGLGWGILHNGKGKAVSLLTTTPTPTTAPPTPNPTAAPALSPADTPPIAPVTDTPNAGLIREAKGSTGQAGPTQPPSAPPSPEPTNNPPATIQADNLSPTPQLISNPPTPKPKAGLVALADAVPVGESMDFALPNGDPAVLVHNDSGYSAYVALCTHERCVVRALRSDLITCPCHGSRFDAKAGGQVLRGPARRHLTSVPITVDANGDVYFAG